MANIKDRTEDFKDALRTAALSMGYSESRLAAVLASFIMRNTPQRSPFIKAALKTMESIRELERFIVKHRKDYVDLHRTTQKDRDNIEHEVSIFIKACKEQIDILKDSIQAEENNRNARSWLQLRDGSRADLVAHKHGVVLILSEQLHEVTSQFDRLRTIRFQDAVNKAIPRRKSYKASVFESSKPRDNDTRDSDHEVQMVTSAPIRVQEQLLDDETRALQVELASLLDAVQETETKMVEVSALNHLMSTHVLQQAQQIEQLYDQAVEATKNMELGNKELSKAIHRNSGSRTFLLLFLFVLTFSILFLDWYS